MAAVRSLSFQSAKLLVSQLKLSRKLLLTKGCLHSNLLPLGIQPKTQPRKCLHSSMLHLRIEPKTQPRRYLHSSLKNFGKEKYEYHEKNIVNAVSLSKKIFSDVAMERESLDKEAFEEAVQIFKDRDIRMRGHIQFIETALKVMKAYNVEKDITAYNKLFDVFPKGKFVVRNPLQAIYAHYPEQNVCGIRILQQMEDNGVMPNQETKEILIAVFGRTGGAVRKYRRLMYWFPRFKNVNPFPVPKLLPSNPVEIAKLGLKRIAEFEAEFKVQYLIDDDVELIDETTEFIATVQSSEQQDMLHDYPRFRPVYVEGPFNLWLRDKKMTYFILRGHPLSLDDVSVKPEPKNPYPHEVETSKDLPPESPQEGPLFAMCSTNSQKDAQETMLTWVTNLQEDNPNLGKIPIYFNIFKSSSPAESLAALPPGTTRLPES